MCHPELHGIQKQRKEADSGGPALQKQDCVQQRSRRGGEGGEGALQQPDPLSQEAGDLPKAENQHGDKFLLRKAAGQQEQQIFNDTDFGRPKIGFVRKHRGFLCSVKLAGVARSDGGAAE